MKLNKKISYLIFIFVVFFALITGVKAYNCSSGSYCEYQYSYKSVQGKFCAKINGGKLDFEGSPRSIAGDEQTKTENSGLFVLENSTIYCPDRVYACALAGQGIYVTTTGKCNDKWNLVTATRGNASGSQYTIDEQNGTLTPCIKGGAAAAQSKINELNALKIPSPTASNKAEYDTIHKKIESITSDEKAKYYCDRSKFTDVEKLANQKLEEVKKAAEQSTVLSEEEKARVDEENARAAEVAALGLKPFGLSPTLPMSETPCFIEGIMSQELKDVLQFAMNIIRIAVPILLIILVAVDFGSAVISNDKDITAKVVSKVVKRIIAAVVIFFIPTIVNILLDMPGISDWISADPSCKVEKLDNN